MAEMTKASEQGELGGERDSTVTVSFLPRDGHTLVVLEHTELPDADSRDRHAHGWSACLAVLRERGFSAGARS